MEMDNLDTHTYICTCTPAHTHTTFEHEGRDLDNASTRQGTVKVASKPLAVGERGTGQILQKETAPLTP